MRARLKELGLESFPMVTGGKGVHVVVPLKRGHSWDEHRDFAEAMARVMAEEEPDRYVANMSKAKRRGKIFVDYLRNQRGATAISPFSTRARPGAYVAVPVSWTQLTKMKDAHPVAVGEAGALHRQARSLAGLFQAQADAAEVQGLKRLRSRTTVLERNARGFRDEAEVTWGVSERLLRLSHQRKL